MKQTKNVLASMHVEVDSDNPATTVTALADIVKQMCTTLNKTPVEGALMLMTAAAFIIDTVGQEVAERAGEEVDYEHVIGSFMATAAAAWNMNGMIFRGVSEEEIKEMTEAMQPGETLQ